MLTEILFLALITASFGLGILQALIVVVDIP
jgi:hypothetical protein